MTLAEVAYHVLQQTGQPMHYRAITEQAIAQVLIAPTGRTPAASLNAEITLSIKHARQSGTDPKFERLGRGIVGLTEWSVGEPSSAESENSGRGNAIPDYQTLMLPFLRLAGDGQERSMQDAYAALAGEMDLSDKTLRELLPSGRQTTFENRVGWAKTYLKKAGLLESPHRGRFQITERGRQALALAPSRIDREFLKRYPEFLDFQQTPPSHDTTALAEVKGDQTPEEGIEAAVQRARDQLAEEVLSTVKSCSPSFFERLVVDLLVKMGYGGTRRDAGQAIGRSGDGGIDGIIKEDRLGLDFVYLQAKRWENTVGRPQIQQFAGALQGQRARKGVFLTTSTFSQAARDYVSHLDTKIVLIDGKTLAQLMIDYDIGVTTVSTYALKRIDLDYYEE